MDETSSGLKLLVTLFVVALNGFFVAAEFALVKARPSRIQALAREGNRSAQIVQTIFQRLDLYLSGCQLGITLASLVLGWLAEPAVASLLLSAIDAMGVHIVDVDLLHGISVVVALGIITTLHMTIGEQAPKIWALERAESAALLIAFPLHVFVLVLQPLIWGVNQISNGLLRLVGVAGAGGHESTHNVGELKQLIAMAASGGKISVRQRLFAENVLGLVNLEVRHILLPRVDVAFLSLAKSEEENIEIVRTTGHSRYPLCTDGLDTVVGIVHTRDLLSATLAKKDLSLAALAKKPIVVPATQALSQFIVDAQSSRRHCAIVVDERGTTTGMVFLEDALEEIVGPIHDEFDREVPRLVQLGEGCMEIPGNLPIPEAIGLFGAIEDEGVDTIGGYFVARLGRIPESGEQLDIGPYLVTATIVVRHRIVRLHLRPKEEPHDD